MSSNQNLKEYNKMDSKKNQTSAVSMTEGSLWKNIFLFSCPLIFSQLLEVMFNLSDVAVVGRFADYRALGSVGSTSLLVTLFTGFLIGMGAGVNVRVAHGLGAGNQKETEETIHSSFLICLVTGLLICVVGLTSSRAFLVLLHTKDELMEGAVNYLQIYSLGMPAMGVSGAAVATLIARIIEIVLILGYVYGKRLPVACGLQDLFGWSRLFVSRFFGTSAPVIANEFMWGLGTTMYSLAYGRMGDEAVAAITIATTIQDILVVLFQGLSAATAVILGNELGAGHLKRAEKYAVHFFILQFIATVGVAVVLIGIRWPIIGLYNITPEVARDVSLCILIFAAYMPAKMFNYVNVVGVLRSGGDTKMCLFLDTSGVWFIGVPLAFLGALVWRLPIYTVYALVMTEEVYKAVLGYIRYRQKKWLRNLASDVG